jgi:hypothetical protein
MTEPELRRLYIRARRASEELVQRLESYDGIIGSRANEAEIADDVSRFALFVERAFRDWHERSRNIRELLEDPDVRAPERVEPPETDPRLGA